MILFLICAAFGTFFLLLSFFAGGHADMEHDFSHDVGHDAGHDSGHESDNAEIKIFSFRSLTVFLACFGAIGAVCLKFDVSMTFSIIWGIVAGIVMAFFVAWLMSKISSQQISSTVSHNDMVGQTATVTIKIPKGGIGEVSLVLKGQIQFTTAKCVDPEVEINNNSTVVVKSYDGGILSVAKA